MVQAPSISNEPLPARAASRRGPLWRRLIHIRATGRSGRVIALVLVLVVLNLFDLAFTLLAHDIGGFEERNPIARLLLDHRVGLIAFKLAAVASASIIFIAFRRHWLAEAACWGFCLFYIGLSVIWRLYYYYLPGS